jgi:hypothetical protein
MDKLRRVGLVSAAAIGFISLSGIGSVSTAGIASAASKGPSFKLTGYSIVEADFSIPADSQGGGQAVCPDAEYAVGGGGYEVTQGLGQDIDESGPWYSRSWKTYFNNEESFSNTGVVVAICASETSLLNYSVQYGSGVTVPADGQAQAVATCPSGTVALGGGGFTNGDDTYQAVDASAPYGTNGWRAYLSSTDPESYEGYVGVVCLTEPAGWVQINSVYKSNPAGAATNVRVKCPAGTDVLAGGPFNSSTNPAVTIGLTTSLGNLEGWHSWEDNSSSTDESVDEWAVCAKAKPLSS